MTSGHPRLPSVWLQKTLRSRTRQSGYGLPSSTPVRRCTRHPATCPFRPMVELKRCRPWSTSGTEYLPVARSEPSPSGVMIGGVTASTVPLAYPSWAYWAAEGKPESCSWINGVVNRRNKNVAAVALANKNACIVWALLAHDRDFRPDYTTAKAAI